MRCLGQQGRGFSRLPQPIKRHEALKNDVSTLAVILATTPYWLWSARIHNAIAAAMSMYVAVGNKVVDSPVCLSL